MMSAMRATGVTCLKAACATDTYSYFLCIFLLNLQELLFAGFHFDGQPHSRFPMKKSLSIISKRHAE